MLKFPANYGFRGLFLRLKHIKNKKKITSTSSNSTNYNRLQRAYSTYTMMVTYYIIDIVTIHTFESWPEEDYSKIYNFQSIRINCDHHDWRARSSDIIFEEDHHRSTTTHDRVKGISKANLRFSYISLICQNVCTKIVVNFMTVPCLKATNDTIVINYSNLTSFVGFMHIIEWKIQIHYASHMHIPT